MSWDCDGQGNCYDPGTGNGQYTSPIYVNQIVLYQVGIVMVRVTVMILEQETDSILHSIHVNQIVLYQVGIVMDRVTVMILEQETDSILHSMHMSVKLYSAKLGL